VSKKADIVLDRLNRLHPKIIDLGLERVERLLARVGNPERKLPPVVHVAGTNGKGSVIAYLRSMLEAAGYRVHVYTSPHLVRFNERIRLAGTLIDEQELVALLEECEAANGGIPITFFEITTVAAFLAFTRHPADIVLLETGLGGRLDATNVVSQPLATLLMPISLDHMQFLGDSIAKIAAEKAGILKQGRPAVVAPQPAAALSVFAEKAAAVSAPLHRFGREWTCHGDIADRLYFWNRRGPRLYPTPGLVGRHQVRNAGAAIAAISLLDGFAVADAHVAQGLRKVEWPARMQRLRKGPLVKMLPKGWELWLDGGHNEEAGEIIAAMLADWRAKDGKPAHLIFGMLNTKNPTAFLRQLAPHAEDMAAVAIPGDHAGLSVEESVAAGAAAGLLSQGFGSVEAALRSLVDAQGAEPRRVLICGSLYLAGSVLARNG
jgi:dihydrofolate synthase / folylpolyglutamate synthase